MAWYTSKSPSSSNPYLDNINPEKIKQAKENLKVEFNPTPEYNNGLLSPLEPPSLLSNFKPLDLLPKLSLSPTWQKIRVGDVKGLTNELGIGLAHALRNTGTAKLNTSFENMLARSNDPGTAAYGKQQLANEQTQQNYLNANPVNSLPAMLGEQIPQIPLWMAGEAGLKAVGKGIGKLAPSLTTKAETIGSKLPSFVKGGLLDTATYGSVVAPVESIRNGDNYNQFLDREKQLPSVLLGGTLARGAFQGAGSLGSKGLSTVKDILKPLGVPEAPINPLKTYSVQRRSGLGPLRTNDVITQSPNLGRAAEPLQPQPLRGYRIKPDDTKTTISEIQARMDKQVNDIASSLRKINNQTKIENIRNQVKEMGGISQGNSDIFEEQRIIPNWIRNNTTGRPLDEVADTLGMTGDELLSAISDSAYKPKDYMSEAYMIASKDPEYQSLDNTLQMLKESTADKVKLIRKDQIKTPEGFPFPIKDIPIVRYQKEVGPATYSDVRGGTWYNRVNDIHGENTGYNANGKTVGGTNQLKENFTPRKPLLVNDTSSPGAGQASIQAIKGKDYLDKVYDAYFEGPEATKSILKDVGLSDQQATELLNHPDQPQVIFDRIGTELAKKDGYDSIVHTTPNGTYAEVVKLNSTPDNVKIVNSLRLKPREQRIETPILEPLKQDNAPTSNLDPLNQAYGQIVNEPRIPMRLQQFNDSIPELPNTSSHIVSRTERQPINADALKTNAYIKTTDNLYRLNQLDKYVEETTGQKLSPADRSYMLALNSRGTGSTTSHILEEKLVNPQGDVIGDSLKSITKQLKNKQKLKAFDDYLVNKHAITRMRAGEKVYPDEMNMTPGMSEAKVKELEAAHPEFKELSQKLYEFQNKLSKAWLVDTGIVPPEAYVKWITDNPHYVPNNRLFSEMEQPSFGNAKRGFANQSNPVKTRTGSQRQIISPLESIMEHVDQYVKVAKRNEVMQTLIRNIKKNPEEFKDWAEILPDDKQFKQGLMDDINKTLETEVLDGVVEQFNKQFDDIFNAKKQRLDLGNVVTGLINGEKVHVKINDPLLLHALTNLKPQAQQIVVAALGQVTRVMKNLTTGINPVFGLARNIWRDIPTAFINSKSTNNPLVYGKDLLGAVVDVMGNKEAYKSYKAMGGGHASSSVSTSRNALAESKARLLPGYTLRNPIKTAIGGLERLNNAVESAPRLAEFKRISKPGDYGSKVKGIYESNDVTTNFNRFGNTIKEVDSIVPYLNAAWQGLNKLYRTFKENPAQTIPKAFFAVTIPSILLYQANRNNPSYQLLSDYIKDNNFLIPKSDGTFIKIPKPREIGVMFGSSVERAMRMWEDQDPEAFNRFGETVKANFMPPVRTIADPIWRDLPANKDFVDRPIVSGSLQKLSPRFQFDEKTSEPAKFIGDKLNLSPQQIDYVARSYLGGIAQLGLPALTKNASVGDTLMRQITADPTFSNDIIGDFYNTKTKMDTSASDAKATGNNSLEQGKNYKTQFNKAADQLSEIRKQIDKVQAGTLPKEEKEVRIRALQLQMLNIAKKSNDAFKLK